MDPPAGDYTTIALQYEIKHVEGSRNNAYFYDSANKRVHWSIGGTGELGYHDGTATQPIGNLEPGWNTIKIVANVEEQHAYVYLNDMDTPLAGPMSFRKEIGSWVGADVVFSQNADTKVINEMFIGDVKVWGIE